MEQFLSFGLLASLFLLKAGIINCLSGIGPFYLLVPTRVKNSFLGIPILLSIGMGMIGLSSCYVIPSCGKIIYSAYMAIGISLSILAIAACIRTASFVSTFKNDLYHCYKWIPCAILNSSIVFLLLAPSYIDGLTIKSRIGIDQLGYAVTGQYLLDGGNINLLKSELMKQTGREDAASSAAANASCLEININIASEFLIKSLRWYPATVAAICALTGDRLVESCQMLILFFPLLLSIYISWHIFTAQLSFNLIPGLICSWAVIFNCNLLNNMYEGQHAQIYAVPLLAILISQLMFFRQCADINSNVLPWNAREFAFTALIMAFLMAGFSELTVVVIFLTFATCCFDVILRRKTALKPQVLFFICLMIGIAATGPYAIAWPKFILAHAKNLQANGGFWQPQWGLPHEIFGLSDMYQGVAAVYVGRSSNSWIGCEIASIILMEIVALYILLKTRINTAVWLAIISFVALIFIKVYWINHIHNYQFMKAYTILGIPITILFLASTSIVSKGIFKGNFSIYLMPIIASLAIISIGSEYIMNFQMESKRVPAEFSNDHKLREALNCNESAIIFCHNDLNKLMASAFMNLNFMNLGWSDPYLAPHQGKKIYLLAFKADVDPTFDYTTSPYGIVYESSSLIVYDTHEVIKSKYGDSESTSSVNPGHLNPDYISYLEKITNSSKLRFNP